ncbi:aminotransferase class III-fold pyridoxal phosphate-dependent enzyme [Lentzea roselyniae]|uniref:Aminotransferase class III-fold pyridoxal phosphate-dependent enzyme n=1 Tax=Lentzea roselyniae TaxID=531940 RepID=A0ABP7CAL3_9PSEU
MTTGEDPDFGQVLEVTRQVLSRGRAKVAALFGPHLEVSAQGSWVYTQNGTRYLNAGGYGVFLLGARHPVVEEAVVNQIRSLPLSSRLLLEPAIAEAAHALTSVAPAGMCHVYFGTSGAEAVEAALKMARAKGKRRLISAVDGYHGRTMGALTVSAREMYQAPFRPLLPDATSVAFGNADALAAELRRGPEACVIVEPVQGEAGVRIPPAGYLTRVEQLCREHRAFLVLDEILTGLGRVGTWWGADRERVRPDAVVVGKTLSGGIVPVAATLATTEAFIEFDRDPLLHVGTFSGAPIAMAAARATITVIRNEGLVERSAVLGERLLAGLRDAVDAHCGHLVRDVRGAGLLLGVELVDPGTAGELITALLAEQVIVNHSLNSHGVVRLTPPAIMTTAETDFLLTAFEAACRRIAATHRPSGSTAAGRR